MHTSFRISCFCLLKRRDLPAAPVHTISLHMRVTPIQPYVATVATGFTSVLNSHSPICPPSTDTMHVVQQWVAATAPALFDSMEPNSSLLPMLVRCHALTSHKCQTDVVVCASASRCRHANPVCSAAAHPWVFKCSHFLAALFQGTCDPQLWEIPQ